MLKALINFFTSSSHINLIALEKEANEHREMVARIKHRMASHDRGTRVRDFAI